MKKGTCVEYTIYWYNPERAKTGYVHYTTLNEERAIELFYKNYDISYKILRIHN